MSDELDGDLLLGDTGFHQPPEAVTSEPIGDINLDDLPELEDAKPSDNKQVLKDKSLPQEEKSDEKTPEDGQVNPEGEAAAASEEEKENQGAKDAPVLTKEQRQKLFEESKVLREDGKLDEALEKLTSALSGVRPDTAFPELPACLRALAEIHYKREEYEKAVHFVQAEKMYYEAALLDTSVLQSILNKDVKQSLMEAKDDSRLQQLRANEYETLARFCVGKDELPLALEYAAKAAKLRETVLGPDHEETVRSLDFMTSVYADLGKQEYAESLEKFERSKENPPKQPLLNAQEASPEPVGQPQEGESFDREIRISLFFFTIMIFIAIGVLICVSAYAYCELTISPLCESTRSILSEQFSWIQYHLHKWLL